MVNTRPNVPTVEGCAFPMPTLSRSFSPGCEATSPTPSPSIFATAVGGLFFPLAGRLGLPPRSTVTTKVLQKAVWAGANNSSYPLAAEAVRQLAGIRLSPKQIRRLVGHIGRARLVERDAAVEQLQAMPLPQRRAGSQAVEPPLVAVISMDGGRYQRRDNFRNEPTREAGGKHWRETKAGCLLSMDSPAHDCDPAPEFPEWLATSKAVAELAKISEKAAGGDSVIDNDENVRQPETGYEPPELVSREVLASGVDAETFGWQLEARAWQLGFPRAERQAFVADGLTVNWVIHRRHFPRATPILDLMHALSYAWSAASAVDDLASYRSWAEWIWQGEVDRVIAALVVQQQRLGPPPDEATSDDPRQRVSRALTYYTNNRSRMNYPAYRQQGLPLTSSHMESTIKQLNHRIKGTEKFWQRNSGEAVLQLRADTLSDTQPLNDFWRRWQSQQTGSNRYETAA